jgi:predicted DNA-binding transcriptional regulator AlpA|tara:strand:- start:2831 stop:3013 length:183 start_codon:yes stop_codon:yes gene_type:complete
MQEPLLTVDDIQNRYSITSKMLRRLIKEEKFPSPICLGNPRTLRWREEDLREYEENGGKT